MRTLLLTVSALLSAWACIAQTNSEISENNITKSGKGFVYQFKHLGSGMDPNTLMCINNGKEQHFDRFGMGNITVSVEQNENALTWTFPDYNNLTNSVRLSHCKFPVGNCSDIVASGINLTDGANKQIKLRMKSTVDMNFFIVASSNDGGNWISHDGNFAAQTLKAADGYKEFTFPIADKQWNGQGDLSKTIGWEFFFAKDQSVPAGSITFDWITFGDGHDEMTVSKSPITSLQDLSVFPNPVSKQLNVKFKTTEVATIQMKDLSGKLINSSIVPAGSQSTTIDVSTLSKGMYILNIVTQNGTTSRKVVVK